MTLRVKRKADTRRKEWQDGVVKLCRASDKELEAIAAQPDSALQILKILRCLARQLHRE